MGVGRQAVTGERDGADNQPHPLFAFQFKLRKALPQWAWTWLAGIVATAERTGKVGVLVVKRPRQRDTDALVILRWGDWVALHGESAPHYPDDGDSPAADGGPGPAVVPKGPQPG